MQYTFVLCMRTLPPTHSAQQPSAHPHAVVALGELSWLGHPRFTRTCLSPSHAPPSHGPPPLPLHLQASKVAPRDPDLTHPYPPVPSPLPPQASKVAPRDPDLKKKLTDCDKEVKRLRFEEALATPVRVGGMGGSVTRRRSGCALRRLWPQQ